MIDVLLDLAVPWVYVVVFALSFAEGGALIGLFLPGETAMLLGGVMVYEGHADLTIMLIAACGGAVLGDSAGYWLGRLLGPRLRRGRLGRKIGDKRWERASTYLSERGGRAIFFGRFLGFLRTLVPPVAGSAGIPYPRFLLFNIPAALIWAGGFLLLGLAAGGSWQTIDQWAGRGSAVVLLLLVLGAAVFFSARYLQRQRSRMRARWEHLLESSAVQQFRRAFRPQITFLQRRLDPHARFGFYVTTGLLVAALGAGVFGAVVDSMAEAGDAAAFDRWISSFFRSHRTAGLDGFMRTIAEMTSTPVLLTVIGVVGGLASVVARRPAWLLHTVVVGAGALVVDDAARALLSLLNKLPSVGSAAFPSGPLTLAGAWVVWTLYSLAVTRKWSVAVWTSAAATACALITGVAAVYRGDELASGVIAGLALGAFWAATSVAASHPLLHPRTGLGR